ncbi:MAG: 7TM diverse intracellular signaling domain-containing protein [Deltaproteobacteria bacterium]|nr:7TM diverse intracellular signaling domain-containing protein [Deltaproteobacteria bacterium]
MPRRRLIGATLIACAALAGAARADAPLPLEVATGEYRLAGHFALLEDPDQRFTLAAVQVPPLSDAFVAGADAVPNLGLSDSAWWVRLPLRAARAGEWYLEMPWPVVDRITAWLPDGAGGVVQQEAGDALPFATWPIAYRNPSFRLDLPADSEQTVYLRVAGADTMLLPLTLWSADAFARKQQGEAFSFGVYYGALAVLAVYNLILLLTLRDRAYLHYVLLVGAWTLYHASLNGFAAQHLWPHAPHLAQWSIHLSALLAFGFAGLFARSFLLTATYAPRLDRALRGLTAIGFLFLLWPLVGSVHGFIVLGGAIGLSGAALMVVSGAVCWRAGFRPARYYVLTWSIGIAALFVWGLRGYGLVPSNVFTDRAFELVVLSTAITLSLGLADRFNLLRRDLERSVREQGRLLGELQTLNQELAARVTARTADLAERTRQLEAASRHKSAFLAHMSHELRTPLTAIIGFAELLANRLFGGLTAKQAEYVEDIRDSGQHLLALINDVLDLSRIEAGRMELEPSRVDLPAVIDGALTLVRERAERQGVALACAVDADVGELQADERKVRQVLVNLLANAVKFTPSGGRVDVHAARRNGSCEIAVRDTGVGIAAADQQAIFEEFRQVGEHADAKTEGSGLGLSLARRLVELHGGRLWVRSAPGEGSTFTFSLPVR